MTENNGLMEQDMTKAYKRTIYWLNTTYGCGALAVDQDGYIYEYDTAPVYRWMSRKKMRLSEAMSYLKNKKQMISMKKLDVEEDPF
jgi:hypothetical protein